MTLPPPPIRAARRSGEDAVAHTRASALGGEMVVFIAGGERFALSVRAVEAVIDMPEVRQLPEMPDGMLGVAELRESLVPVYSAARTLNVTVDTPGAALVARAGRDSGDGRGRRVVIAVAAVDGVEIFDPSAWTGVGGAPPRAGLVRGVVTADGVLTTLIDAATFLDACCGRFAPEKVELQKVESREQQKLRGVTDMPSGGRPPARGEL